uniref:Lachesin isoform X1 n=1 Tax=Hirondellea gigas TaxID=1518452 RepID=A0A6A7G765_9CRUS
MATTAGRRFSRRVVIFSFVFVLRATDAWSNGLSQRELKGYSALAASESNLPPLFGGPPPVYPTTSTEPPVFQQENNTELHSQIGTTAVLHCPTEHVGENTVSWVRRRDYHLLTVGTVVYSSDQRFSVRYISSEKDWQLHIRYVQKRDEGMYECQIATHPPISLLSTLHVVEATSEILGGPEKYMTVGSSLRLVCVLRKNTQPPSYVFWYHGDSMINYDSHVKVDTSGEVSVLFLDAVGPQSSGNYSCVPSNTQSSYIHVHVLRGGETPAAIHSGSASIWQPSNWVSFTILSSMSGAPTRLYEMRPFLGRHIDNPSPIPAQCGVINNSFMITSVRSKETTLSNDQFPGCSNCLLHHSCIIPSTQSKEPVYYLINYSSRSIRNWQFKIMGMFVFLMNNFPVIVLSLTIALVSQMYVYSLLRPICSLGSNQVMKKQERFPSHDIHHKKSNSTILSCCFSSTQIKQDLTFTKERNQIRSSSERDMSRSTLSTSLKSNCEGCTMFCENYFSKCMSFAARKCWFAMEIGLRDSDQLI